MGSHDEGLVGNGHGLSGLAFPGLDEAFLRSAILLRATSRGYRKPGTGPPALGAMGGRRFAGEVSSVDPGDLEARSAQAHIEAVQALIAASGQFESLALTYEEAIADRVWEAVSRHRPVLSREMLSVPVPGARPVQVGLLIAGGATTAANLAPAG